MSIDPTDVQPFVEQVAQGPLVVRAVVGVMGLAVMLWGSRLYQTTRHLLAFAVGAVLGATVLGAASFWVPGIGPFVVVVGSLLAGCFGALAGAWVHRLTLVAVGALSGLLLGAGLAGWFGLPQLVVGAAAGLVGALVFPWAFPVVLEVLTALGGAALVAWALGMALEPWLVLVLWVAAAILQLGAFRGVEDGS